MADEPQPSESPNNEIIPSDILSPNRRGMLGIMALLGAAITAMIGGPILGVLSTSLRKKGRKPQWIELGYAEDFEGVDHQEVEVTYQYKDTWLATEGRNRVMVSHSGEGEDFVVLSTVCTHLGCGVHWKGDREEFFCPCHGGVFDKEGQRIAGPPRRPLKRYQTRVEGEMLQIFEDYEA